MLLQPRLEAVKRRRGVPPDLLRADVRRNGIPWRRIGETEVPMLVVLSVAMTSSLSS